MALSARRRPISGMRAGDENVRCLRYLYLRYLVEWLELGLQRSDRVYKRADGCEVNTKVDRHGRDGRH